MQRLFLSPIALVLLGITAGGVLLLAYSFLPSAPVGSDGKTLRAIGWALLFLGGGELLNHPVKGAATQHNSQIKRTPCSLGNLFDMLSIICLFIALSLWFFPAS